MGKKSRASGVSLKWRHKRHLVNLTASLIIRARVLRQMKGRKDGRDKNLITTALFSAQSSTLD